MSKIHCAPSRRHPFPNVYIVSKKIDARVVVMNFAPAPSLQIRQSASASADVHGDTGNAVGVGI